MKSVLPLLTALLAAAWLSAPAAAKDLRTKEQRLYEIELRSAQWQVDSKRLDMLRKQRDFEAIQDLFEQKIETLDELNRAKREYQQANNDCADKGSDINFHSSSPSKLPPQGRWGLG